MIEEHESRIYTEELISCIVQYVWHVLRDIIKNRVIRGSCDVTDDVVVTKIK